MPSGHYHRNERGFEDYAALELQAIGLMGSSLPRKVIRERLSVSESWLTRTLAKHGLKKIWVNAAELAIIEAHRAPSLYQNPETWLDAARTAIDICRKSPPSTATVIWPNK